MEETIPDYRRVGYGPNPLWSLNVKACPIMDADMDQVVKDMILLSNMIVDQLERRLQSQSPDGVVVVTIIKVNLLLRAHAVNNL